MFGGATLSGQYLNSARKILLIFGLMANIKQFLLTKQQLIKLVTAQEIDVKLRRYLQEEYNIYGHNNTGKGKEYGYKSKFYSGFNNGKVLFHLNNEKSFSYDLFYTGDGLPVSFENL